MHRVQLPLPEGPQAVDPILQGIKHMVGGRRQRAAPQGRVVEEGRPLGEPLVLPCATAEPEQSMAGLPPPPG